MNETRIESVGERPERTVHDSDIRRALGEDELRQYRADGDSVIVHEFGVCAGAARVDVAVVNGSLIGYELKSPSDSLSRLADQAAWYSRVFDRMTLVVGSNHLTAARSVIPRWWGIIEVRQNAAGTPALSRIRQSRPNRDVSAHALAQLLWRDEALEILERHGIAAGYVSKPKRELWGRLAEALDRADLHAEVRAALKCRKREYKPISRSLRSVV
jgi:hypothetical protein